MNIPAELVDHPFVVYQAGVVQSLLKSNEAYQERTRALEEQLKWFQTQFFGKKSERRVPEQMPISGAQLPLLDVPTKPDSVVVKKTEVAGHVRKKSIKQIHENDCGESALRFGPQVRIEEVAVPNPATVGLTSDQYEIIDTRIQDRLCQEKSAYFVTRYTQQVVKLKESGEIKSPPALERIIDSSIADISVLVGLCLDKGLYHLPIYRQHKRMVAQGIYLSRGTVMGWTSCFIDLLVPIHKAQLLSVLAGKVLSMDETPYKIDHLAGKMVNQYLWFLYGDKDEVLIHPNQSRGSDVVIELLANLFKGTLLVDKHSAYTAAAGKLNLEIAHCWAHARRYFVDAETYEPLASKDAVDRIRKLYELEEAAPPDPQYRLDYRLKYIKPLVEEFFEWLVQEKARIAGLPKTKYSKALNYALNARAQLSVFLSNPGVPIDNNHTERQVRPLVLGRKNFLFCWTELGAERLAVLQSLLLTCQLHGVDPWEYLTDVAVRISTHPASRVHELTPRLWKGLFSKSRTDNSNADSSIAIPDSPVKLLGDLRKS